MTLNRTPETAFTLVELLVVIMVVSILAALFLPALAQGKALARRAKCFSNERQLGLAWAMYSDDTGRIAGNGFVRSGGDVAKPMWIQGFFNHHTSFPDCTNSALLLDSRFAQFSAYLMELKTYKCPSDRGMFVDAKGGSKVAKLRSYAMNCYMGWIYSSPWKPKGPVFEKECSILSPADKLVFMDLHPESVCWPFFGVETNDVFFNLPAIHHLGAASVSYADGHVGVRHSTDPRTAKYPDDLAWHDHRYSSPGNADLAWLRAHSRKD